MNKIQVREGEIVDTENFYIVKVAGRNLCRYSFGITSYFLTIVRLTVYMGLKMEMCWNRPVV